MKNGPIFAFIMLVILLFIVFHFYQEEERRMQHPALNKETLSTANLLSYALDHIRGENFAVAVQKIDDAIDVMNLIKIDADPYSDVLIDNAIEELIITNQDIAIREFDQTLVKDSFAQALYALVVTHLRIAKTYAHNGDGGMAIFSTEMASAHLKMAMRFSRESVLEDEKMLHQRITDMLEIDNSAEFTKSVDQVLEDLKESL